MYPIPAITTLWFGCETSALRYVATAVSGADVLGDANAAHGAVQSGELTSVLLSGWSEPSSMPVSP